MHWTQSGILHLGVMKGGRRYGSRAALLSLLVSLLYGGHLASSAPSPAAGFSLMGFNPQPARRAQNRVVTAVTNSPIYYVKSPGILQALLQQLGPQRRKKPQKVSGHKSSAMSVPLLSNAKPVGWYKLPGDKNKNKRKKWPQSSPIIRLPTKMVANGRPHSLRRFKSPLDRFRLSNLLTMRRGGAGGKTRN